ncbi:ApeA N-terminal domain-containing protein [Prescottella defluvii]|uniref:hypothetical protein n=1 Tax=Prescottella defluvii TaxID=1323361 RepID=UPI0012E0237E|nr:hypothetical protein [Prescottella defluvii]
MSAAFERRCLRPRLVFYSGGYVWVADETQPVAALFDPGSAAFVRLVSWTDLPAAPPGARHDPQIVGDRDGLWVQSHADGPLVRVAADGIVRGEYTEGHGLTCAGASGAWCTTVTRRRRDVAASPDAPPRPVLRPPTLLVARPDGGTRRVVVDVAAVVSVEFDEVFLYLGVEHEPWERVPTTPGSGRESFEVRYRRSVLQVPLDGPVPDRIAPDTHPRAPGRPVEYTSEYADTSYNEAHRRKRSIGPELRWHWHWGLDPRRRDTTIVRGYRSGEPAPATAFDLPEARVVDGATAGDRLWMVVTPGNHTGTGRSVLVADLDGTVRAASTDDIDITDHCRPVGPEPLDHRAYVDYCVRRLDGSRFSDKVHDVSASYVGRWPHGLIHVRFRHTHYPGLTLVARLNLYDEQGVRLDNFFTYVPVMLMEQADTHEYPPRSAAVGGPDGVLYV